MVGTSTTHAAPGIIEPSHPVISPPIGLAGKAVAAVVFSYYPSDPRVRREAEALRAAGADVEVFCLRGEGESKCDSVNGVRVRRFPVERKRGGFLRYIYEYTLFILLASFTLALRSICHRYSIVHVHNMPDLLVFSALIPKLTGARVILDLHDPTPELYTTIYGFSSDSFPVRILRRLEQRSISFADMAITPNTAFKELFVHRGCPSEKMIIVMNSPQTEVFSHSRLRSAQRNKREEGEFKLMFHGSLLERHGLDDLIRAVALLRKEIPAISLQIYGSKTRYVDQMQALISEVQLQDCIRYHGGRSLEQIAELISQADLGIIPNKRTPFTEVNMPTRIFEYLCMGKPVIAPRTRGILDYFAEEEIFYFEPGNVNDLADKIRWIYLHPSETELLVQAGQSVYSRFNWETQKSTLLTNVTRLVAGNR